MLSDKVADYSHVTIPDGCAVYEVHTNAPRGLGNFDRLVSASTAKEAGQTWKKLYSYMGKTVKIVSITKKEEAAKEYDLTHSDIIGRLCIAPKEEKNVITDRKL